MQMVGYAVKWDSELLEGAVTNNRTERYSTWK